MKLKYYRQMIELNEQDGAYLEMCKHFRAIYDTKKVQDSVADKHMVRNDMYLSNHTSA